MTQALICEQCGKAEKLGWDTNHNWWRLRREENDRDRNFCSDQCLTNYITERAAPTNGLYTPATT